MENLVIRYEILKFGFYQKRLDENYIRWNVLNKCKLLNLQI